MTGPLHLVHEFGSYRLDTVEYRLFHEGEEIKLRKKVMDFLVTLVRHPGQLLTRDRLLDAVWGEGTNVAQSSVDACVKELREALGHHYIETVTGRGYRFGSQVRVVEEPETVLSIAPAAALKKDRPPVGALPVNSPFYIKREADDELCSAIARNDTLVLIKGARQVGKSSLLAQGVQYARALGRTVVVTDLQSLNFEAFASIDKLFYALAERIAYQLSLNFPPSCWRPGVSPNVNFEHYLKLAVLPRAEKELVWCLDEVDRLFDCAYKNDFFGLLRYWHNYPMGPLTIALAYATEAHLFITDLNQSPFNVGTRLSLQDFTLDQVIELDRRYGSPLGDAVTGYYETLRGHPFLVHYGLYRIAHDKLDVSTLQTWADRDNGPFGDHLHRMFTALARDNGLCQAVRAVLRGEPGLSSSDFYRLRSAGILTGDSPQDVALRCQLYSIYLRKRLL